jgi:hypothetical protein
VRWWVRRAVAGLVAFVVAAGVLSLVTMLLWNALVPVLFEGPPVTFLQALGLLLLSQILFRGWGPWRHSRGWRHERWRRRWEEKLHAMTPEERERFREGWRRRCGFGPDEGKAPTEGA